MGLNLYVMDQSSVSSTVHSSVSLARRLVCTLALLPIVPALAIIGVQVFETRLYVPAFDELRRFHLLFALLWASATILIWRCAIVWTVARTLLTVFITILPFMQVVYGAPLWDPYAWLGIEDDFLRIGQHQVCIAIWIWLMSWVWWRSEKAPMVDLDSDVQTQGTRVTPIAVRVVASIGTIPFVFGIWLIIFVVCDDVVGVRTSYEGPVSYSLVAPVAWAVWIVVWRRAVMWSSKIVKKTISLAVLFVVLPILALWLGIGRATGNGTLEVLLYALPVIGWGIWMATTVVVWDFVPAAVGGRSELPKCLRCGYLLTGLTGTRCPECGDEPTLDELWGGA